jgi:3-hydroxyacyl-CoA dehydrogenase/enoyl-CoA hydratase/3-hydroxybutyryl-CoA epimerase
MMNYIHWQLNIDDQHIAWLGIDRANERVNSMSHEVLDELNSVLHDISKLSQLKGLIIFSAKEKGFIAGADIRVLADLNSPEQALEFLRKGQTVLARLEALTIPTVALIDGFCMGGGLELALACNYRVATDADQTVLALPEILLGFHPGWGGMVRLPRLIGGFRALSQVILTGTPVRAAKAKALGIVDDVVPLRQLKRAGIYFINKKPKLHQPPLLQRMTDMNPMRALFARLLRREVSKKVDKAHYPAPYGVIDFWEREGGVYTDRAYLKEADSVHDLLLQGDTAKNLIRVFTLRERLKSFSKDSDFKAKHVHVIGAGVMGGDIAAWCARKGLKVTLQDQSFEKIAPAISRAHDFFKKSLRKPRLCQAASDRLIADPDGLGMASADVIIEAVFENLAVKQRLMQEIEARAKPEALIATNTSSIPLDEISAVMTDKSRLVGIHFFNPVAKMELVEVVKSEHTHANIVEQACAFVNQIGRLPLPVKSRPGFLVNRVLMPYLLECVQLLDDGYRAEVIDDAAKSFGMMMGPVELADTVGMDVCLAVAENLTAHFGGSVPKRLRELVQAGKLGRKSGEGFYVYKQGRPIKKTVSADPHREAIAQRLIFRMINEAAACLREGVVTDADLVDAGMIFGTGFAPFRGGPMQYARQLGRDNVMALSTQFQTQYGERFKADEGLESSL